MERCEPRLLLATILVNSAGDASGADNGTTLSFRQAIQINNGSLPIGSLSPAQASLVSGPLTVPNTIDFAIPGAGEQVIKVNSALPAIANPAIIDGTSQPGYVDAPVVAIDGSNLGTFGPTGLTITAGGTTVKGLAVINFGGNGITIQGARDCVLSSDYLGVNPSGTPTPAPNQGDGVFLINAPNNVIGQPGAGNVIGGNRGSGIDAFVGTTSELIQGNFIGILPARSEFGVGPINIGNSNQGISLRSSTGTTIGGTAAGAGNVISQNTNFGVFIAGGSDYLLQGNLIGTDSSGLMARGNGAGVLVGSSPGTTIGGTAAGAGNVISANNGNGIAVVQAQSTGTLIEGNKIGVGIAGVGQLGNAGNGIELDGAPGNSIVGNIIAANSFAGVYINTAAASGNSIRGNIIGLDAAGNKQANSTDGIFDLASPGTTIGGTTAADRNVISGNGGNGVSFRGPTATGNLVIGNYLGTDLSGGNGQGNNLVGNIIDGVFFKNSPGNTVGGTAAGAGNVIGQNRIGVDIETFDDASLAPNEVLLKDGKSDDNVILGNKIGTDVTGEQPVGNYGEGVFIGDGSGNLIGGPSAAAGNLISANLTDGVSILSVEPALDPTSGNVVRGNTIGLDRAGTDVLPNGSSGVRLTGAINTSVGGATAGSGNVLSGNVIGLDIAATNPGAPMNALIQGNIIGLGSDGLRIDPATTGQPSLSNTSDGVVIEQGASGVTIGGTAPGDRNVIAGNRSSGVRFASGATGDLVLGNLIGIAGDGQTVRSNNQSGVFIAEGSSQITVGGTTAGSGNVISGNSTGVTLANTGTVNNLIEGNIIGLTADGSTSAGNVAYGFLLLPGTTGNTIGGSTPGARNVISSNGQGITIDGPGLSGNLVQGNYIGVDATGSMARPNDRAGIAVNDSGSNTIGGTAAGAGNVISGNTGPGLIISGSTSSANLVVGNLVGLDPSGTRTLGNLNLGILVDNAAMNTIGGETLAARNVVSGNGQGGIVINGPGSTGAIVSGNLVGTDITGLAALGNIGEGILVDNAPGVVVGGSSGHDSNIVSGNLGNGITIFGPGSVFDLVAGNLVGTDATGDRILSNVLSGVFINGAPGVTIGGTSATFRNVISANDQNGVRVAGAGSAGTRVLGNLIGVDASGLGALGNFLDGILLDGGVGVTVGGTVPGSTNILSGNGSSGVEFGGSTTRFNVVTGNLVGTDYLGRFALPNSIGVFVNNAPSNQVGGTSPFSGNLISGNVGPGVEVFGVAASGNAIEGNRIGTDLFGLAAVSNQAGVFIDEAPGNVVGGIASNSGNLISGNQTAGVVVQGTDASGNLIQGNLVGTDSTGTRAIGAATGSAPQQQSGILLTDAPRNVVGGSVPTAANVASGNVVGVVIAGFNAQGNLVIGNLLGTDVTGRSAVGNVVGVYVNGSSSNTIGGSTPGFGNLISGNSSTGISLFGAQTTRTVVAGNRIGTNLAGSAAVPNQQGIFVETSPSNTIGGSTRAAGNLISGNAVAGVYLFSGAAGNLIQDNTIGFTAAGGPLGNLQYGILFFNAANNINDKSAATGNKIGNSGIGNFREFTGPVTTTSTTATRKAAKASVPRGPLATARA